MIHVKLTVQGEPDVAPFTTNIQYTKEDEKILANLFGTIQEKIKKNLRININECITLYSRFVVSELYNGNPIEQIQKDAFGLLSPDQVMIGVPETMQKMSFEVTLDDGVSRKIILDAPIRISEYVLKSS